MACLLPLPEVSPGRRGQHISRSPGSTLAKAPLPPKPVLSFWLTSDQRGLLWLPCVDAHFWLTLIFICLPPSTAQVPLALLLSDPWCPAETPTLGTQLHVGGAGLHEVKEGRGQLGSDSVGRPHQGGGPWSENSELLGVSRV